MYTKSLIVKMTLLLMVVALHTFSLDAFANPTGASITAPAADGTTVTSGSSVTFTGTGTDPDGLAITYTWNFSDGTTQTGQTVSYQVAANATSGTIITATLSLSDANGAGDTQPTRTVTVATATTTPISNNLIYVANYYANTVTLIDPASNNVVATLNVNGRPYGRAISSDGKYTYIVYPINGVPSGTVSVFDTNARLVTARATVGNGSNNVAITPDGSLAYTTNFALYGTVTVTNTSTNTVTATIPLGRYPTGVAITPDGTTAYVASYEDGTVSVIDIASNTVTSTIQLGLPYLLSVGNVLPTTSTPFSSFSVQNLTIAQKSGALSLSSNFTLGETSVGIAPAIQLTTLFIGNFALAIPPGAFKPEWWGAYRFGGTFQGETVEVLLQSLGNNQYLLNVYAFNANLLGITNPTTVRLNIGGENGTTSVSPAILP